MQGILVKFEAFDQHMIEQARNSGKKFGVWFSKKAVKEESMYDTLFGKTGKRVDYIVSNQPQKAMKARD